MKKILFSAVLLGALASCSQNEVQEIGQFSNEIQFSTLNNKVSRAANDTKSDYQVFAKSFGLTYTGTPTWYIDDVLKSTSGLDASTDFNNATTDLPTKTHYWPNVTGDWAMKFFAFAPSEPSIEAAATKITYGASTSYADRATDNADISFKYIVKTTTDENGIDAQEDFTIALPLEITKANKSSNNVNLQFKHMLTRILVKAALNQELLEAGYEMKFTTPQLQVVNTTGTISVTSSAPTWSDLSGPQGGDLYEGSDTYLILPQPAGNNQIILPTVTITKNGVVVFEGPVTYTVKAGDIPNAAGTEDDDTFLAGKSYNMNITIAGDSGDGGDPNEPIFGPKITFSSEVANWEEYSPGVTQPPVTE
ncbi:MAG: fimbrillin family protein [Phocaeicola sp.]